MPFSEPISTKYKLWTRTVDYGLTQLSLRTNHNTEKAHEKPKRRRQREHQLKFISCLFI